MTINVRRPRAWAIAGVVLLGVGSVVIAARERPEWGLATLANHVGQAIQSHWPRTESILSRFARRREPTSADAMLRAERVAAGGRSDAALAILATIPDADPLAAPARLRAGQLQRKANQMRLAEAALLEALRLDPKLIQAHRELVYLYGMQCRRADLNAQFKALATLIPLDIDDLFLWTSTYGDIWINSSIRPELERYLAADPTDRRSRLAMAEVLLRDGNLDESEEILRPLPDSDADALVLRARIALNRSNLEQARALLGRGPAEHAGLARLRGQVAMRSNDSSTAARQFQTAVRLEPTSLESVQGLSQALKRLGDADGAAASQEQAERLRTLASLLQHANSPEGHNDRTLPARLGAACEAAGLIGEARGWYQIAIGIDPLDAGVQRALYRLRDHSL